MRIGSGHTTRGGFTLIELLVVIAVIVLVITLLVVGLNAALTASRARVATITARNLGVASSSFEREFGFEPPLLHDGSFVSAVPGGMGTVTGPFVSRGRRASSQAIAQVPVPGVGGATRYYTPAYVPGLNRQFLRGDNDTDETNDVPDRYDFFAGSGVRISDWTQTNQRYSKHTITYMLMGAGPEMIDGVAGPGMTAPDRTGVFAEVRAFTTVDPIAAARTPDLRVGVTTADRVPGFFSPSDATPLTPSFADPVEWRENGATEQQTEVIPTLREQGRLAFNLALTDEGGRAYRYYRWVANDEPRDTAALNIPAVLIDPQLLLEYTNAASTAERRRIDLTGGSAQLRSARSAIVGAGPNGVFGTESVEDLITALARPIDRGDPAAVAELRREAWADNAVEIGR